LQPDQLLADLRSVAQPQLHDPNQGDKVIPTEQPAKSAVTPKTGLFAPLCALLNAQGTGAPSRAPLLLTGLVSLCALAAALAFSTAAQAGTCPNEQLRAETHSTNLPDCRAYELVTPPFKEASISPLQTSFELGGFAGMSVDGSHVAVTSIGNFGDSNGTARINDYELTRTASGWSETNIDLPVSRFPASAISVAEEHDEGRPLLPPPPYQATPDFGKFLYFGPKNSYPTKSGNFWIGEADGSLHSFGPGEGGLVNPSTDLSHVLFNSNKNGALEEEDLAGGPPVPVGVDTSGNLCSASDAAENERGGIGGGMSADGSVVFFDVPAEGCSAGDPLVSELFARVEESRTAAISEPSKADCSACDTSPGVLASAVFDGNSADGSKVFFTTTQPLLGSETETSANIYEYDSDAPPASPADPDGRIVHVTAGKWGPGGAQIQDYEIQFGKPIPNVMVSEDGSHVYFVAAGALEGASNNQGQHPKEGEPNLYVFDSETGATAFIATVSPSRSTRESMTPNGQFFVFTSSTEKLTPGDTSTAQQVFEYDAQTGELVRVSIGQNGFNDNGNSNTFGAQIPKDAAYEPDYPVAVSNDGAYVAFESSDGLTPGALNGYLTELSYEKEGIHEIKTYYAENVYEYHDGNVYLISDGQDTSFSLRSGEGSHGGSSVRLRGMSPSGEDIFFETADRLVPQDLDTQVDLYDVRIDGGFPAPVSLLPSCTGDACQGPLSPAPTLLAPGSEFQAGGNPPLAGGGAPNPAPAAKPKPKVKPKACKQGYVKKKDKCVKKPKAKKSAKGRK
jgi:hypothetical protein